jgi:hypothetical protein
MECLIKNIIMNTFATRQFQQTKQLLKEWIVVDAEGPA